MRHPHPGAAQYLSERVDACIVNAGDGTHEHPTQALLDAFSLEEKLGDLGGKQDRHSRGHPPQSRVALSNIYALQHAGGRGATSVCS